MQFKQFTYPAGMSKEVRADRFDISVSGLAEVSDSLEVFLSDPALR